MAAPVPPGAPRPGTSMQQTPPPPNYNPNFQGNPSFLADNVQNLNLNRAPPVSNPGPRPVPFRQPPPFPHSAPSPGFPSASPVSRAPPPPGAVPRGAFPPSGPLPSMLSSNSGPGRPTGPPFSQPPAFGSRPFTGSPPSSVGPQVVSPPATSSGPFPSSSLQAGVVAPPPGARPSTFGSSLPVAGSSLVLTSNTPGAPISNGPSVFGSGAVLGGPRFPPSGGAPQPPVVSPPVLASARPPPQAASAHSILGTSSVTTPPGPPMQQPPMFPGAPQGRPLVPGSPYGAQWSVQPQQPATSDYIVRDTGNCSPRYMRCTINQIPCTADLLATSGMQLALLVQPFALPHASEEPIQVVDFGESGPVRCARCKGYINPFMKFIDQGRRFICNLCGYTDETPRDYHCNLGPDGRRRDADERPELCRGTVEFVASKEYMVRDPMPAVYFFLIDVSMNAIQTGATAGACSAISQVLSDLPEGPRTYVGIATFDSTVHFYNLKRALQQPLMLIVPDVQDVYTPLETDVVVQLSECRQHLELLLESIPSMFQNSKTAESAFGAAIKAAYLAMKSTGGKLMVFQSVLPSVGIGALSAREAEGRTNISAGEK
ncbi:protein transport protein Sec24-like At4g32640, partial [Carica papaya]|uniref:protein transport protein Sec24-like At4g32640 n=1 Tax=Carica papaya TaxID=3649 RepID=UPI000B8CD8E2